MKSPILKNWKTKRKLITLLWRYGGTVGLIKFLALIIGVAVSENRHLMDDGYCMATLTLLCIALSRANYRYRYRKLSKRPPQAICSKTRVWMAHVVVVLHCASRDDGGINVGRLIDSTQAAQNSNLPHTYIAYTYNTMGSYSRAVNRH